MPSSPQSSLVMAKTNSALDVPEEPDVEVAEEEPPTSTLSFFTAVRYIGPPPQHVDPPYLPCRIARWMAKAYGYAARKKEAYKSSKV